MKSYGPPVTIAHAYGNNREALRRALAAPVDIIEADVWFRAGELWVRHERRLGWLPLLLDRRFLAAHAAGRFALGLWRRYYVRPDIHPLRLAELLDTVAGKKRLLLDVKGDRGRQADAFAATLQRRISERNSRGWVAVCGQHWPVLHQLRKMAGHIEVRYSIERPYQWERFLRMVERDAGVHQICMQHRFMDEEKARFLEERGIEVYCWTVDDEAEARRLLAAGVEGIISNDLSLLASLRRSRAAAGG